MTGVRDGFERVATARLIGAAATLDPAGRALLNLWMHRGLSDAALAEMAGLNPAVITARKLDIVEHLSTELGLPPYEIVAALGSITRTRHETIAAREPVTPAALIGRVPAVVDTAPAGIESRAAEPVELPPVPPLRLRRGGRPISRTRLGAAAVILIALGIAVVRLAASHHVAAGGGRLAAVAVVGSRRALRPLAGAPGSARGDVALARSHGRRRLTLELSGLPAPGRGHYEAFLYTTIIDSRALGPVPAGGGRVTFALPQGARRFRWIDVSLQPPGFASDSGQSVVRALNPAAMTGGRATGDGATSTAP